MPLYRYVKSVPRIPRDRRGLRAVSFLFIAVGTGILIWTFWPIVSFSMMSGDLFSEIVTPLQDSTAYAAPNTNPLGSDLTNPNAWFPTSPQKRVVTPVNTYTLSIQKLKIQDATVTVAGNISYDGISYKYIVYDLAVTDPSDLSALAQRFDDSYLTLVTCVPPGTYWQRLHVFAKLARPAS
ncbi:MAG: sortase [Candidatus Gottesmanbacteria bacterium]|nr:sortase [Candidatus Gottesmanbacteria bacterium]